MTARIDLDRVVTSWLKAEAPAHAPSGVLRTVMGEVAVQSQERHFTQRIFGDEVGRSPRLRWALIAVALAMGLVGTIVAGGALLERPPRPAPSGTGWIAFAADHRAGDDLGLAVEPGGIQVRDIYIVGKGTSPRRIIGGDTLDQSCPAFSPDGQTLAYVEADVGPQLGGADAPARPTSDRWTLVLTRIDDRGSPISTTEQRIELQPRGAIEATCFRWSPDGQSLGRATKAWDGGPGGIEIVAFADGLARFQRLERTAASATAFDWAPDASKLALFAAGGGTDLAMIVPATGEWAIPGPIVGGLSFVADRITWSPDGARIAIGGTPGGSADRPTVRIVDAGNLDVGAVTIDGAAPAWSPDGRRLAVLRAGGAALDTMNPDGSAEVSRPLALRAASPWLAWAPDGGQLLYLAGQVNGSVALVMVPVDPASPPSMLTPATGALASAQDGDVSWQEVQP